MKANQQRSTTDQKPNAWVVNPKDRGRKPIKSGNIYLKDGKNFEIELFNPLREPVLAEIKVNGKSVSSSGLVLRPGERFYLDCFMDDRKKFVFNTYSVEDSEEVKESISANGVVEVFFYKEETLKINNWQQKFQPVIERHYHHYGYPYWPYYNGTCTIASPYVYPYNTILCGGTTTTSIYNGSTFTVSNTIPTSVSLNGTSTTSFNLSNAVSTYTSNVTNNLSNQKVMDQSYLHEGLNRSKSIETGRIEKGEDSSQKFESVDMQFEKYHISSVIYQLFPESQKPIETKEIKSFCSECGRKLKGSENFCPDCGTKLK
jgi:hypothetical protein